MNRTASSTRPHRRHRAALLGLLVVVAVLAVLLVVADRIAKNVVEHRLAARIQSNQQLPARPDVDIHGFPFLTQVIAGKYSHVSIKATSPITEQGVQLNNAEVQLHGVRVKTSDALNGKVRSLPVRSGTGSAFISYTAITSALAKNTGGLGVALTIKGSTPGHAVVSGPFGLSVTVSARVSNGALTVTADPAALKTLPALAQPIVASALNTPIPLPPFPFNVALNSAELESTGVQLHAAARNSTFPI